MKTSALAALAAALAVGAAWANDSGFSNLEHQIESAYHVKRTHIPFLGLGHIAAKTASPFTGITLNLAVFDDVPEVDRPPAIQSPGPEWTKVIESSGDRERTLIFAKASGKTITVLVLSEEPGNVTLVESRVNAKDFLRHFRGDGLN